jgi:GTP-binding protein EngB required for normal cell division
MKPQDVELAAQEVLAVLPARTHDLARLRTLARREEQPTVTVIGKYNHGKSRLLNELMGHDIFAVADRRETVALAEHVQPDVRWLDAPGLDADVAQADDAHASEAAWLQADIRLFVHAAKEGELDAAERKLLQTLRADQERTQRQTLFVLTQVDQLADDAQFDSVSAAIASQAPGVKLYPVSSTRHRQGVEGGKKLLLEKSGIPALRAILHDTMARVPQARRHETRLLLDEIGEELQRARATTEHRLQDLRQRQQRQRQDFEAGLVAVFEKVQADLQPILDIVGVDHALVPDTAQFEFKLTEGKKERARIQVAYSHACIAIRSHLVKHGVVGLPVAQQTSVRSLDTVMVAVMGVSVKYRDDLRRLFFEQSGRDKLACDFAHYFERSEERVSQALQIVASQAALDTIGQARAALARLEAA